MSITEWLSINCSLEAGRVDWRRERSDFAMVYFPTPGKPLRRRRMGGCVAAASSFATPLGIVEEALFHGTRSVGP